MSFYGRSFFRRFGFVLCVAVLLLPTLALAEIDITSQVEIIKGRLLSDRLTGDALLDVAIRNISGEPLPTPVKIVVAINTPAVTLATADGQTADGLSYVFYDEDQGLINQEFLPGQLSSSVRWRFTNPTRTRFIFTTAVFVQDPILDTDSDGVPDDQDGCPTDPEKTSPGVCGCNLADDANNDGLADCGDNCRIWYADFDSDGYGNSLDWLTSCENQLAGYVANPDDCDDTLWSVSPASGERCDDHDSDCNTAIDDECSATVCSAVEVSIALPCLLACDGDTACMAQCLTGLSGDCLTAAMAMLSCVGQQGCLQSDTVNPQCVATSCLAEWQLVMGTLVAPETDLCPTDINKTQPGICGCGLADVDMNADGVIDCLDTCPDDPSKLEPGECGCGIPDVDTDNDGVADCLDQCPTDSDKTEPGTCGCGLEDDYDGDGQLDCLSDCPVWYIDRDVDGYGDPTSYVNYCIQPEGYVANPDDCNDSLWSVNPSSGERCDEQDSNCDGEIDNACITAACSSAEIGYLIPCLSECGTSSLDCASLCINGVSVACRSAVTNLMSCGVETSPCAEGTDLNIECLSQFCPDELQAVVGPLVLPGTDLCPSDENKTEPGVCGCGLPDDDSDGDGEYDCTDLCPDDPAKIKAGVCGCGVSDADTDADGQADCVDTDDDNDGYLDAADCQPFNPLVNPATEEICDGLDNNCDGTIDENCSTAICTNTEISAVQACADSCSGNPLCVVNCLPDGFSTTCLMDGLFPLASCLQTSGCGDLANMACIQNSCSDEWVIVMGELPTECAAGETRACGTDVGICQAGVETCTADGLWSGICTGEIGPEPPACNGLDNDCDGEVDIAAATYQWCFDQDGDTFIGTCTEECNPPDVPDDKSYEYFDGVVTDCADDDGLIHPGAEEICDGKDNNCDGVVDEGWPDMDNDGRADCVDQDIDGDGRSNGYDCAPLDPAYSQMQLWALDSDGDLHSPAQGPLTMCYPLDASYVNYSEFSSHIIFDSDCNDNDPSIYKGQWESCHNRVDDNCNGLIDGEDPYCNPWD